MRGCRLNLCRKVPHVLLCVCATLEPVYFPTVLLPDSFYARISLSFPQKLVNKICGIASVSVVIFQW